MAANPNCDGCEEFVFNEIGPRRPVSAIRIGAGGKELRCDVVAVHEGGVFSQASAVKVADSGAGYAYLIFGGEWGIRLRPETSPAAWDLRDAGQWGETFKLYGEEADIFYINGGA